MPGLGRNLRYGKGRVLELIQRHDDWICRREPRKLILSLLKYASLDSEILPNSMTRDGR